MINFAPNAYPDSYRFVDSVFLTTSGNFNSTPKVRLGKSRYFEARFILRYMSAFFQELETLSHEERMFPVLLHLGPGHGAVRDIRPTPIFVSGSYSETRRIDLGVYSSTTQDYYKIIDQVRLEANTRYVDRAIFNRTRNSLALNDTMRLEYEAWFSREYFIAKSVFWMRYLARVSEFVTPTIKKAIRDEIALHAELTQMVKDSKFSERDKGILLNHLTSPIPKFRKKYGRVDVSLEEYWSV